MSKNDDILLTPWQIGGLKLDSRVLVAPHAGGGGNLLGTVNEFERYCEYWMRRISGGIQWIGGGPGHVANPVVWGFEPTGLGATAAGHFRHPLAEERWTAYFDRLHAAGGFGTAQLVVGGGQPLGPSAVTSGYAHHVVPHVIDAREINWLVREYAWSARFAVDAGADVIEVHANHSDVLQWFLSPLTNHRTDQYGVSEVGRRRLLIEILTSVRHAIPQRVPVGVRLCMDELLESGMDVASCQRLVCELEHAELIDYVSLDVGDNWGATSYIPNGYHQPAEWAYLAGAVKSVTLLPVIYVGRIDSHETARAVLSAGHADAVGIVRAAIADPDWLDKAARSDEPVRPCIGVNDCIHRFVVDGLTFGCAVNPVAGRESERSAARLRQPATMVIVGGGPAGTETAALAAESGFDVSLYESHDQLGGQLLVAAKARLNVRYRSWLEWQGRRLGRLGIAARLGRTLGVEDVLAVNPDVVVLATGATPRNPFREPLPPEVVQAVDVLTGTATLGQRVVIVAEDDSAAPLTVAHHVAAEWGRSVVLLVASPDPSPLVGRYSLGGYLAELDRAGVEIRYATRVRSIESGAIHIAHSYSGRHGTITGADSVVLSCGSAQNDDLYLQLSEVRQSVFRLGDAYAPRRLTFATRQAFDLVQALLRSDGRFESVADGEYS